MRAALPVLLAFSGLLAVGAACLGEEPEADETAVPPGPSIAVLAQENKVVLTGKFDLGIDLQLAACTTVAACPETVGTTTKPSLLTGLSCGLSQPWDGFLLFSRRIMCDDVEIQDPAGTTGERAYSAAHDNDYSEYIGTTQYLEPLSDYVPCTYEAEAFIVPWDVAGARGVYHRQNPARMTWHVGFDESYGIFSCTIDASSVGVDYPASVTASKSSTAGKFDYAAITAATGLGAGYTGARVRYVLDATFPVTPTGVSSWQERDLWVDGTNARIDSTCVYADPTSRKLVSIGVLLRENASPYAVVGVVVVYSTLGGARFECKRDTPGGPCSEVLSVVGAFNPDTACASTLARLYPIDPDTAPE